MTTSRAVRYGVCLLIASGLVAGATSVAADEILYIPLNREVVLGDGSVYGTRLLLSNLDVGALRRVSYSVVSQGQDGTGDPTEVTSRWTQPQSTRSISVPNGPGMLVVTGSPEMLVSARWSRQSSTSSDLGDGADLPVLSCRDAAPADGSQVLQGFERRDGGGSSLTSFAILNLGPEATACTVSLFQDDGTVIVADTVLNVAAKSSLHFRDVLGALGLDNMRDNRISTSCDQPFYSYGIVVFPGNGATSVVRPTRSLGVEEQGDGCGSASNDPAGDFISLTDLNWTGISSIQGGPWKGRTGFDGHQPGAPIGGFKPIDLAGVRYPTGISWFGNWSRNSSVTWTLDGAYRLATMKVGFDDSIDINYEWGIVNTTTHQFIRLQRPPDGWGGIERPNQFRIGASGTLRFYADGTLIHETVEMHNYSPAIDVTLNLQGVNQLRIEMNINAHEELNAWYRRGLTRREFVVGNSWFDMPVLVDTRLYHAQ